MKKFLKVLLGVVLAIAVAFGAFFLFYGKSAASSLQKEKPLTTLVAQVQSKSDYVPYDQIAPFLLDATVAIEDSRFYSHGALDYIGLLRAVISQFIPSMAKSGGSTISQQVVKNLYGQYDAGLEWKAVEIRLAQELEKNYTKDEILALYVNIINYGDGNIGISKAAKNYFGYTAAELTDEESALLAGIPQNPSWYQLSNNADQAKQKQAVVLDAMVKNGYITQSEADTIYLTTIYYHAGTNWYALYVQNGQIITSLYS